MALDRAIVYAGAEEGMMELARRRFLQLATAGITLPAMARLAVAESYPTALVRIIVGFAAGGSADAFARPIAQWLSERLGQPFIVENRPGAATNIATEAVARAAPDGHTLLLAGTANAINATLYDKLKFDFIRDFAPVAIVVRQPHAMVVHPSVPAKTVAEFIAYAKASPGKITMASAGHGTPGHVTGEMFKSMAGIDIVHVPYRGAGPAVSDLLSGHTQFAFVGMAAAIGYIQNGQLRPAGGHHRDPLGGLAGDSDP
jgi:tripartite-type tricarboxylate transporter receptor subunit TctC